MRNKELIKIMRDPETIEYMQGYGYYYNDSKKRYEIEPSPLEDDDLQYLYRLLEKNKPDNRSYVVNNFFEDIINDNKIQFADILSDYLSSIDFEYDYDDIFDTGLLEELDSLAYYKEFTEIPVTISHKLDDSSYIIIPTFISIECYTDGFNKLKVKNGASYTTDIDAINSNKWYKFTSMNYELKSLSTLYYDEVNIDYYDLKSKNTSLYNKFSKNRNFIEML